MTAASARTHGRNPSVILRDDLRGAFGWWRNTLFVARCSQFHVVADPPHRRAQRASPDFGRNDLGYLEKRRFDGVGMTVTAMGPEELRQGGDASAVNPITQVLLHLSWAKHHLRQAGNADGARHCKTSAAPERGGSALGRKRCPNGRRTN